MTDSGYRVIVVLLYQNLFAVFDVQSLLRGLVVEETTVEGMPDGGGVGVADGGDACGARSSAANGECKAAGLGRFAILLYGCVKIDAACGDGTCL